MNIPDKLIGFTIFKNGKRIGAADIELPTIEYMSDTLSGAGIAGETETPALGQLKSMNAKFNFRTLFSGISEFIEPEGKFTVCRGSIQQYDTGTGQLRPVPVKLTMLGLPKSIALGKFEVGNKTDTSAEVELTYLQVFVDNKEILEIDKMNYKCAIDGKDYLEEVQSQLGM